MKDYEKIALVALIDGLTREKGNQYYNEKYIPEENVDALKQFIKNFNSKNSADERYEDNNTYGGHDAYYDLYHY